MKKNVMLVLASLLLLAFFSCKSSDKNQTNAPKSSFSGATNTAPVETVVEEPNDEINNETNETETLLDQAMVARQVAIDAGADVLLDEQFADADAKYNELLSRNEAGENVDAELKDIASRFNAYAEYAKAVNAKDKIDKYGLANYDQNAYNEGVRLLDQVRPEIEDVNANPETAFADAQAANASLQKVLFAGYKAKAKEERMHAFEAKQNADSVYAAVAQKEKYEAGVQNFRDGDASYAMQNPEASFNHYQEARTTFEELFAEISDKRAEAEKAIDEAKARVAESAAYAAQADNQAPLVGDDIKGIEDEDAVLLEEETYENPEEAAADIPETIVEGAIQQGVETLQNESEKTNDVEDSTFEDKPVDEETNEPMNESANDEASDVEAFDDAKVEIENSAVETEHSIGDEVIETGNATENEMIENENAIDKTANSLEDEAIENGNTFQGELIEAENSIEDEIIKSEEDAK